MEDIEGGKADISILEHVCEDLSLKSVSSVIVIKSTIPIGTTQYLRNKYKLNIIHNPEFLTARNADIDFLTPARIVLGGDLKNINKIHQLYKDRFPGSNILKMSSNESETVKYIANCFFALKVLFFNEMFFGLQNAFNLDWETIMGGVLSDGRIGISHHNVPGHDGKFGVGGLCFPKDLCALISTIEESGGDPMILKAAWDLNKKVRPEMDWGDIDGAVSKKEGH